MSGAADSLRAAAAAALSAIEGIGRVYDAPPLQAAFPYALVLIDSQSDWSHKTGAGRELRLAASLFDRGERPLRLRALVAGAEQVLGSLAGEIGAWQLVSMTYLRTRIVSDSAGAWAGVVEFRARMLAL